MQIGFGREFGFPAYPILGLGPVGLEGTENPSESMLLCYRTNPQARTVTLASSKSKFSMQSLQIPLRDRRKKKTMSCFGLAWQQPGQYAMSGRSEEHTSELQSRQYLVC